MNVWDWLNLIGSVGFILCLMPQLARTVRLRRADDLSILFLLLVLVSSTCILAYMLKRGNHIFATAQAANIVVWGTVLYYKLWPSPMAPPMSEA